ncbi:MAG TPA: citryl-CoA lyase [Candidatus Magasanikbacteria bacterium]|nr:citryl-CoA lyase [Candidatus Magasanikbacteria bacterium]
MKFKTSITKIENDKEIIRGKTLESLVKKQSFVATIFFLLFGRLPKKTEEIMFNALFVSVIDHGPGTSSALNARVSTSAGNSVHASLAAGILGFGERHGMAVDGAMKFFSDNIKNKDIKAKIQELKEKKVRIPGYGHKVFTKVDPRSVTLFDIAKKQKILGNYCKFAGVVQKELNAVSSKLLPLNIDGAIAAILLDMKVPVELGNAIFLIGRIPGLLAHIYEEKIGDVGIRRLEESDIEYI